MSREQLRFMLAQGRVTQGNPRANLNRNTLASAGHKKSDVGHQAVAEPSTRVHRMNGVPLLTIGGCVWHRG